MLDTRAALARWQQEQAVARPMAKWGTWHATGILKKDAPQPPVALDAKGPDSKPVWTPHAGWKPGRAIPLVPGGRSHSPAAIYIANTVTAAKPVTVTVGLGGGDRLEAWLDGKKVADAVTCMNSQRYGCGFASDRIFADQCVVDLALPAGSSRLQIRLSQQETGRRDAFRFWFSPSPNPAPHLWQRIRRDFPPHENPLLELVPHTWFENDGWLCATDMRFEREFLASSPVAPKSDDVELLDLCFTAAERSVALRELDRLGKAVAELHKSHRSYRSHGFPDQVRALRDQAARDEPDRNAIHELRRRALLRENPLLKGKKLLFARRHTYNSRHYYDDYYAGLHTWGGNLTELDLATGETRDIVLQLAGGIFDRYDISHDGRRVVFGYRAPRPEGFRIWECNVDGSGLRQITFPPDDEAERIERHSGYPMSVLKEKPHLYGHWTDDMHPCYLPDGRIVFVSSRSERSVLCGGHALTCTTLCRMDADGKNMHQLSQGALTESTPTVLDDGRILYTRWEYVYKGIAAVQSLWAMRPDGTGSEEIYGHNIDNPGVFFAGRQIPGMPDHVVATGCGHEPVAVGSIQLIDRTLDRRIKAAMTNLTPEVETRGLRGLYQYRNGRWNSHDVYGPFYCDPYPLADPNMRSCAGTFFLVSHNPTSRYNDPKAYGIWLIDRFGNRVLIHDDPEMSCFQPVVLAPRPVEPELPRTIAEDGRKDGEATVLLVDLYRNLPGVEPGAVKYLRVMEQIPRSWVATQIKPGDAVRGQQPAVSLHTHIWVAVLLGTVPVEADGSAHFKVPARRNIFFQALDENYMEVQKMRTFVNFQPGESRSCLGCHDPRHGTPMPPHPLAMREPAVAIAPQPGDSGPRPIHYPADVQPIFDRHCVRCHGGDKPKARLDLTGTYTEHFSHSYENLLRKGLVSFIQEWTSPVPDKSGPAYVSNGSMMHSEAVSPYTYGSHKSRLVEVLRKGHPDAPGQAKVKLSREEFVRLVTWVDANAPFYGSYFGRRNIAAKRQPGFRAAPTLESARGVLPPPFEAEPIPAVRLAAWRVHALDRHPEVQAAGLDEQGGFSGKSWVRAGGFGKHEAISVAMRVKTDNLDRRWNPLLFTENGNPSAFHFSLLTDGTPNVAINIGPGPWVHNRALTVVPGGEWHHVAVVCDARYGGRIRFFVDGNRAGDAPLDLGIPLDLDAFRIGAWNRWENNPNSNFHGMIDDIRIYSGSLTDEQVRELAQP